MLTSYLHTLSSTKNIYIGVMYVYDEFTKIIVNYNTYQIQVVLDCASIF